MTFEKVAMTLAEKTGLAASDIKPEMTLAELKLDSLDMVDVLMILEDEFGVALEPSEDMKCVADIVRHIEQAGTAQ